MSTPLNARDIDEGYFAIEGCSTKRKLSFYLLRD